jgi:hypothetical protein
MSTRPLGVAALEGLPLLCRDMPMPTLAFPAGEGSHQGRASTG